MKLLLCLALIFGGVFPARAYLGNYAEYGLLDRADVVIVADAADVETVRQYEGFNPDLLLRVNSAQGIKGGFSGAVEYFADGVPFPRGARTLIIYLKEEKDRVLRPVNRMSSTIPSSLPVAEVMAAYQKHGSQGNMLDVIADLFAAEKDGECALFQARILATGPVENAKAAWKLLPDLPASDALALAQLQVGLAAAGTDALLQRPRLNRNFSKVGVEENGTDPLALGARAGISAWTWRNAGNIDVETMLGFALQQSGAFQADIISGFSAKTPEDCVLPLFDLLRQSRDMRVKYACFRAINKSLGKGEGDRGSYVFAKNSKPYIEKAEKLVAAYRARRLEETPL